MDDIAWNGRAALNVSTLAHAIRLTASNFLGIFSLAFGSQSQKKRTKIKLFTTKFFSFALRNRNSKTIFSSEHRIKVCVHICATENLIRFFYIDTFRYKESYKRTRWYQDTGLNLTISYFNTFTIADILICTIEFKIVSVNYFNLNGRCEAPLLRRTFLPKKKMHMYSDWKQVWDGKKHTSKKNNSKITTTINACKYV